MVKSCLLFVLMFLMAIPAVSLGQGVTASARVDSNKITVGDWLQLHFEVKHPENVSIDWHSLPDSLEGFEILKRESPAIQKNNQEVIETSTWKITAFDSGMFVIPALQFSYRTKDDTAGRMASTSQIPVFVGGVAVDTTQEIKDIKPPLSVPISFAEILPYLIALIVLGGLIWLVYYIMKKRKRGESIIPEAPPRPAHEIALDALRSLEAEHLWQRGKIKEYYSALTDIVRLYIEQKFHVLALESTTEEILSFDQVRSLPPSHTEDLKDVLVRADFVKFAKFQPAPAEHESSFTKTRNFVESTWQKTPETVSGNAGQEVTA